MGAGKSMGRLWSLASQGISKRKICSHWLLQDNRRSRKGKKGVHNMTEIIAFALGVIACAIYHAARRRLADRKGIEQEDPPWGV